MGATMNTYEVTVYYHGSKTYEDIEAPDERTAEDIACEKFDCDIIDVEPDRCDVDLLEAGDLDDTDEEGLALIDVARTTGRQFGRLVEYGIKRTQIDLSFLPLNRYDRRNEDLERAFIKRLEEACPVPVRVEGGFIEATA